MRPPGQGPPRSFADRFSDMGGFPGNSSNMRTNNHHPQQGHHPGAQQHHPPTVGSSGRGAGDNVCGNSSDFDKCESIPIKVVHSGKPSSHRPYEGASHTTQVYSLVQFSFPIFLPCKKSWVSEATAMGV